VNDSAIVDGVVEMHITDTGPGEPVLMLLNIILASAAAAAAAQNDLGLQDFVEITTTVTRIVYTRWPGIERAYFVGCCAENSYGCNKIGSAEPSVNYAQGLLHERHDVMI